MATITAINPDSRRGRAIAGIGEVKKYSRQHSLKLALQEGGRTIIYCPRCKFEVGGEVTHSACGTQVETIMSNE